MSIYIAQTRLKLNNCLRKITEIQVLITNSCFLYKKLQFMYWIFTLELQ